MLTYVLLILVFKYFSQFADGIGDYLKKLMQGQIHIPKSDRPKSSSSPWISNKILT